jgi:hypothetical protein
VKFIFFAVSRDIEEKISRHEPDIDEKIDRFGLLAIKAIMCQMSQNCVY